MKETSMAGLDGSAMIWVQKRPSEGAWSVKKTKNVNICSLIGFSINIFAPRRPVSLGAKTRKRLFNQRPFHHDIQIVSLHERSIIFDNVFMANIAHNLCFFYSRQLMLNLCVFHQDLFQNVGLRFFYVLFALKLNVNFWI